MRPIRVLIFVSISLLLSCALPLVAAAATYSGSTLLRWTTPGDDGRVGQASYYDLRYSINPITEANFASALRIVIPPPKAAGTRDSFRVIWSAPANRVYFALKTADEVLNWSPISNLVATPLTTTVGVEVATLPASFAMPWPNPASQTAHLAYSLPRAASIQIEAFDLAGRHVRTIASGSREAGQANLEWDLRDDSGYRVAPGMYLVRMQTPSASWTRRLLVVR